MGDRPLGCSSLSSRCLSPARESILNVRAAARIAHGSDLAPELGDILAPLGPPRSEIGFVGIHHAGVRWSRRTLGKDIGVREAAHRSASEPQALANLTQTHALRVQTTDLLIPSDALFAPCRGSALHTRWCLGFGCWHRLTCSSLVPVFMALRSR